MKKGLLLLLSLWLALTSAKAGDGSVLFRIDGDPVSVGEFEYIYNKNNFNNKADYSEASLREYLDLFINFRLKVREAEARGLDKDPKLLSELKVYQEQLYNSFYDREKLNPLVDEAIARSASDVSVSHIYVSLQPGAADSTVAAAEAKINEAWEALEGGADWNTVTAAYSEDQYTRENGGELGWYTALQIAYYPLENAAWKTPPGSYSRPVRTGLGFHIVRVNDRRPARGLVRVAIIKLNKKQGDAAFNQQVAAQIDQIANELAGGKAWGDMVSAYSQDPSTRENGGEMEWFGISKYDPVFEEAAFSLDEPGQISEPVETSNAWYILKLVDRKRGEEQEFDRDVMARKVKQSDRYTEQRREHVAAILSEYGFELLEPGYSEYRAFAESEFAMNSNRFGQVESAPLVNICGTEYTNLDLAEYLTRHQFKYRQYGPAERFSRFFDDFKEEKAIAFHVIAYGEENTEYGALLNEYRDGILLFDLMEENVWTKAVQDTAGLRAYYEKNKTDFMLPERAVVRTYATGNKKSAAMLVKALKSDPELSDAAWLTKLRNKGIQTRHEERTVHHTDPDASKFAWAPGIYTVEGEAGTAVWRVTEILKESPRSFQDSRGFAIAAYQEYLEEQWIEELRSKYEVTIDEAVLLNLVK